MPNIIKENEYMGKARTIMASTMTIKEYVRDRDLKLVREAAAARQAVIDEKAEYEAVRQECAAIRRKGNADARGLTEEQYEFSEWVESFKRMTPQKQMETAMALQKDIQVQ
jgi:hypothetical protein